ncbi:FtsK/SpoIIIE domain-containing protein [Neobacillus cucumis]|uniref:FtsK/SpoIIIE domain-containing protein n=1 Tax=Neobacillus cucumis TaxID=1740721 RepID=UPI002E21BF81|nr:FtsK/SpoIIIE domain-containing protein [Neobacillus cucumis]MED4229481.1 FtsK/SpoIIIE domain-containing protein [Neobacillus cucumis]
MGLKEKYKKFTLKIKMLNCFRAAGLYFTSRLGDKTITVYPKVHAIVDKKEENCTEVTFTLINGLDPSEVKKKLYVFQQYFGRSIDLKGDLKKYTLFIYHTALSTNLIYKYETLKPYLEGIKFPIVTGQKKNGRYLILDALELPHVIIQGVSGSGKSSAIRVILTTLIKTLRPEQLDIYCIDGKKAEFQLFKKVEHVKDVVHSHKNAVEILNKMCGIMSEREDLQEKFNVPHIDDLPESHRQKYILIAIDEMYEYMDDPNIQTPIIKIASKGRSVGIILLLSAQRFDADVIDTKARANFNIRLSFRAVDRVNARLLGTDGAEKIKGEQHGRFILNYGDILVLQSPHLKYKVAEKLLNPFYVSKGDLKDVTEVKKKKDTKALPTPKKSDKDLDLFL